MQIRQQIFLTLLNFAAIIWIIWVLGGGDRSVEGEGAAAEGHRKAGTDAEVMQVLRKLQAPQVKHLPIKHKHL